MAPPKLELSEKDISQIEVMAYHGMTEPQMAALLGMSKATFERRQRDTPGVIDAMDRGRAKLAMSMSQVVTNAGKNGDVEAAKWVLMKKCGWTDKRELELSTAPGKPIVLAAESPEEREHRIAQLTQQLAMMSDGGEDTEPDCIDINETGNSSGTGDTVALGNSGESPQLTASVLPLHEAGLPNELAPAVTVPEA